MLHVSFYVRVGSACHTMPMLKVSPSMLILKLTCKARYIARMFQHNIKRLYLCVSLKVRRRCWSNGYVRNQYILTFACINVILILLHTVIGTTSSRLLSQDDSKQRETQTSGGIGSRFSFYRRSRLAGSRRWSYSGYGRGPCYRRCEYVLIRVRLNFTSCTDTVRRSVAELFSVLMLCPFSRKRQSSVYRTDTDTDTDTRCNVTLVL